MERLEAVGGRQSAVEEGQVFYLGRGGRLEWVPASMVAEVMMSDAAASTSLANAFAAGSPDRSGRIARSTRSSIGSSPAARQVTMPRIARTFAVWTFIMIWKRRLAASLSSIAAALRTRLSGESARPRKEDDHGKN